MVKDPATPDAATSPRKRIVFLINSLAGGGAERVMAGLLAASSPWRDRYEMHLILLDIEAEPYPLPEWLHVHRLDSRFSLLRGLRHAVPLLRRLQPDLCLSFLTRANLVAIVASRMIGAKAIISERISPSSHHGRDARGRLARWATRLLYPRAARVICPSAGVARDLIGNFAVKPEKTVVIANPLDRDMLLRKAQQAPSWMPPAPYIVAVGRLVESKNMSLLLGALRKSRGGLHLVILGDGPLRKTLEQEAQALGGRVHFPGFVENPFAIVRRAEMFVLSSSAEGFPNALAEAMVLGVPVIATNCRSGPSEILDEREDLMIDRLYEARYGLLVPTGDEAALAEAIDRMMDAPLRKRYREAAQARASQIAALPGVRQYWDLIEGEIR